MVDNLIFTFGILTILLFVSRIYYVKGRSRGIIESLAWIERNDPEMFKKIKHKIDNEVKEGLKNV